MKTNIKNTQTKNDIAKKKYSQPTLTIYGKLNEFTASGSGQNGENTGNPTKMA